MNYQKLSGLAIIGTAFSLLGASLPAQAISFNLPGDPLPNIDVADPGATASLNVTQTGIIDELYVDIELEGTGANAPDLVWSDLDIVLSHDGTTVQLAEQQSLSGGIFNLTFSDASLNVLNTNGDATGDFRPSNSLEVGGFQGQELSGLWELNFQDNTNFANQGNQLVSWSISGTTSSAAVPFEFSPGLGLFMVSGLFLGKYWRKQKKETPSLK